ncbi:unnamed protein product [Gongylonema pulchrum]|uniref:Uncharacterized protein n=1 Tax=Gongylonema pulchrum TaxID=637853 RepID=A0A3P6RK82_9BILA|nr:unnamed protein product [Gongylonema pulchrum]
MLVPKSSVISNVASIRGAPFYREYSDLAIFEVEPVDKLEVDADGDPELTYNLKIEPVCLEASNITPPMVYTIASFGRRKDVFVDAQFLSSIFPDFGLARTLLQRQSSSLGLLKKSGYVQFRNRGTSASRSDKSADLNG